VSIVVTGATGQLGRLVIEYLTRAGVAPGDITALGRSADRLARFDGTGIRTAVASYDEPESLDAALAGAEKVLLVSGSEVGQRVRQHGNVIDAAVRAGVSHLVYTSAPHADSSELILAPEHKATEELIIAADLPFTILRNNWYTENYASATEQAEATGNHVASTGDGRVASASRTDYAEAAAVVLTTDGHDGAVYELSGDFAWTGEELAAAMSDIVGERIAFLSVTSEEHADLLRTAGLDEGAIGFVVGLDANIRDGLLGDATPDMRTLLGRPTTPLAEGLRAALDR
jgi:NAD(P)H dehydrogenase (quinone)